MSQIQLTCSIPGHLVASYDMPWAQGSYSIPIPMPLVASDDMPWIQGTYSTPRPLVASYDMPWMHGTYSIPRHLVTSYDMPWIQGTYSIPGTLSPHTTCFGYRGPILSPGPYHLIRHALDTGNLFYPRDLITSYDMP